MGVLKRVVKPVSRKGKKVLLSRESKLIEDPKVTLFIRGRKTNEILMNCMRDLYAFKKPEAVMLSRKNDIVPFENAVPIEAFCKKLNASLFIFGYSNKKRPNTLIFGRTFAHQILDMIELSAIDYKPIQHFNYDISSGIKPCLLFAGDFNNDPNLERLQNLLIDMFQREEAKSVSLQANEHVWSFTAYDGTIYFRSYKVVLKKSGTTVPRVELEEAGPSIDFCLKRCKLASSDLFKKSCKKPRELKAKKVKNISKDVFDTTKGRVHVSNQKISELQTKKMKGLKKKKSDKHKQAVNLGSSGNTTEK